MRVLLTPHGRHPESVMVTMAHELQHAWEVPHDSSVTDEDSMRELFKRIGHISVLSEGVTTRETRAAR